ncbi:MAG: YihY/virulence factor BrkB family protein [Solirubrobacterales bacterium]
MEASHEHTEGRPRAAFRLLQGAFASLRDHGLTDWAAALTYYGILSIFPALIFGVAILGLAGDSATHSVLHNIDELGPGPAQDVVGDAIREISGRQGAAGVALVIGLAGALWSASGYVGAFSRAANVIHGVTEERPSWKLRPLQIAITLLLLLLVAMSAIGVVLSGPLAKEVGKVLGVEGPAVTAWNLAKWPVIAAVVTTVVAVLYYVAPDARNPGFRLLTPGSVAAMVLWVAASAGFAIYVGSFASYNKVYGSLAGVVVFLVWLWISNLAVLFGAELNAEIERRRSG